MISWAIVLLAFVLGGVLVYFWRAAAVSALNQRVKDQERRLEEEAASRQNMSDSFRLAASDAFREIKKESDADVEQKKEQAANFTKDVVSKIEEYHKKVQTFENERHQMYGKLENSLSQVLGAEQSLRSEITAFKKALTSSSGVRGNFGEAMLEQIFEQNDLVKGIGFDTQVTLTADDGSTLRPDFVIHLPGKKKLIIDSKEVASEYLLADPTNDPAEERRRCEKLVASIRSNFTRLSRKEYQSVLDPDLRFVVMFIPSEGAIRAAFQTDSGLFQEAKEKRVILASPMTIVPLIQLIQVAWQQQNLADNARALGAVVETLGDRLFTFAEHLQSIRQGIKKSVDSWDEAAASWAKRVAPQIERARQLGGKIREIDHPELLKGDISDSPLQKKPNLLE